MDQAATWRPARPDEDDAIVGLSLALFREDPSPHDPSAAQVQRTLAAYRAEPVRGRAVVLDAGDHLGGYAFLASFWSNELGGEVCVIDELYVAPAERGHGHGSILLRTLAERPGVLWPAGAVALELETTAENHRARSLYQRLGFGSKNAPLRRLIGR